MPAAKRLRRPPTDDWAQLQLYVGFPEQEAYELLRPIGLFGQPPAERAQATGAIAIGSASGVPDHGRRMRHVSTALRNPWGGASSVSA